MTESRKLRRQAAWLCFEPHLNAEQRLVAVQMLEQGYQAEGVTNQINYIGAVCSRFGIGEETRKSLHLNFHRLLAELPVSAFDPLPMMLEHRSTQTNRVSGGPVDEAKPRRPKPPAQIMVFSHLAYQIQDYCRDRAFFDAIRLLVDDGTSLQRGFSDLIEQWAEKPDNFYWALNLEEAELKQFVHLLYTAVCDVLGPVEADQCFHQALAHCEKRPEAKEFPPRRFL